MKLYIYIYGYDGDEMNPSFPTKGQPENVGQTHTGSRVCKKTMFMNSFHLVLLLIHGTILVYLPRS